MEEFNYEIVRNPENFMQNRLEAHSDHEFYGSENAEKTGVSDFKLLLNGIWKFSYAKNYSSAIIGFHKMEYDCRSWDDIRVPAHIQMEGYDVPQYANTQYPWEGHENIRPGEIPEKFNPVASYVKYFELPDEWNDRPVYISFQGVESGMALWLNGIYIGYSEDSFTPSEFDLTQYIKKGENKLAVMVFKWTAGSWCEDQDFFRFSGIFRDVYLYTVPCVHINDLRIQTLLDDDYKSAELAVDMKSTRDGLYEISLEYEDKQIFRCNGKLETDTHLSSSITEPELWSAEYPALYDLKIKIFDSKGQIQEYISEKTGFRRFELLNKVMCLNGKRIVFKGTNRHEFGSKSGRVLSDEDIYKDLVTIKKNNINAIRTSHYPNKTSFYRMADRLGIYLIDETNMETHGTWDAIVSGMENADFAVPGNRKEFLNLVLDRARSMFERDKNHPSILIWSCGNESFGGHDIFEMTKYFHKNDSGRLVHYEGFRNDSHYRYASDMESTMYDSVEMIKTWLGEHRDRPYINCEYAHAMGNSCGGMSKYTDLTEEDEMFQGGFIWDYIDQSLTIKDRYGVEYQGYGGDFNDRPSDYSFSGNGIVYGKDRKPSPKMQEVKFNYQNIKIEIKNHDVKIRNRNLFTNTDHYKCIFILEKEGKKQKQIISEINIEPLDEKNFPLPFDVPENDGEYTVTVSFVLKEDTEWAKAGYEVAYGQQVYGHVIHKPKSTKKLIIADCWHDIGVHGDDFEAIFSKLYGGLISYKYGGKEMISGIPKPNFWRAMTENDMANQLPFRANQWKIASMYSSQHFGHGRDMTPCTIKKEENHISVTYTYHLGTKPEKDCRLSYTVYGDGEIDVNLHMNPSADVGELPEFSVMFKMDADYNNLIWYGLGPDETYNDRCHAKLGIYQNTVEDNMAEYLVPQECGNKEGVRYAEIMDKNGRGLRFSGDNLGFSALPYTPHEIENAIHSNELPPILSTYIRIGYQMGIGGDDTWGALTHPEFMLKNNDEMDLKFSFKGI